MKKIRFLYSKSEFAPTTESVAQPFISSETSVNRLQNDFFEALAEIGELVPVDRDASVSEINDICRQPGVIYASFYEPPKEGVACRLLQHTRGGLMLPGSFLGPTCFRKATANLVETQRQKTQLVNAFASNAPYLGVFAQRLNEVFFKLLESEPVQMSDTALKGEQLIYSGRLIANKGIIQTARCMNIWPSKGATLTLIGNFDPEFQMSQNTADHHGFEDFFIKELAQCADKLNISFRPTCNQSELAGHLRKAEVFVYPSFHEDEASGNAAHEAVLSGIPAVVTDWSGLGQLGQNTRGGCIKTYPSLGGVRYSLEKLRKLIFNSVRKEKNRDRAD